MAKNITTNPPLTTPTPQTPSQTTSQVLDLPSINQFITDTYSLGRPELRLKYYLLSLLLSNPDYKPGIDIKEVAKVLKITKKGVYKYINSLKQKQPFLFTPDLLGPVHMINDTIPSAIKKKPGPKPKPPTTWGQLGGLE